MAAIRHLKAVGPAIVKRTVALPVRKPNAAYRSREHLTEREVERLVEAAKGGCGREFRVLRQPSPVFQGLASAAQFQRQTHC